MKNFKQYYDLYLEFFDEIDGAVKHIDHLEENVLNKGKAGVIEALENIDAAIEYFVGETDYKISTKFDGAPAIVAGQDPDGNFFVGSKSAFAADKKIPTFYRHECHTEACLLNLVETYNGSSNQIKGIEYLEKKFKELDPSGEILRKFFRYWNKTPSGLGSPSRRGVDP